jgi:outer membrane protein OmpA-like peptidoglycan-associated protein
MSDPRPRPGPQHPAVREGSRRRRRALGLGLLAGLLAAGLAAPAGGAAPAAAQETSTTTLDTTGTTVAGDTGGTVTGASSSTVAGATSTTVAAGGQSTGGGLAVTPRVLDLVFRTVTIRNGKDTATLSEAPGDTEVDLAADVLFAFDSDKLTPAAQADLEDTAKLIRERAKGAVRVEGHTDSIGSQAYNLGLSQRRAQAVRDALARLLSDRPTQFSVRGFGASKPIAPNKNPDGSDNPKGRARNRRVTVAIPT